MDMRRGMRYGMINTVTEFDEGRRIAWSPKPANGLGARFVGRIWRDMARSLERLEDLATARP
jgi:hypothetical protein